jgi:hypothetical protein
MNTKSSLRQLLLACCLSLLPLPLRAQSRAADGFAKLKTLVGEWEGKTSDGSSRTVRFEIVSGGTAVLETLKAGENETMVTLYHQDGARLMATHYCSAGNQPRMVATAPAGEIKTLKFSFAGVTNLASPKAGHMRSLTISFADADHFSQTWTYRENGKDTPDTFTWVRKR